MHSRRNQNLVLPSLQHVYAHPLTQIVPCQWLNGGVCSYRKEVFKEFQFDERLKGIACGEDLDFSYRIYLKHPYSLYQTPLAKCIHLRREKRGERLKETIFIHETNYWYLLFKFNKGHRGWIAFAWSRLGWIIWEILKMVKAPFASGFKVFCLIQANLYLFFHRKEVKQGRGKFLLKN